MDDQELFAAECREVFNYAKCIAAQISGHDFAVISPSDEDFELAIQFHGLVAKLHS